jgi:ABC-2 type transport system permease protein
MTRTCCWWSRPTDLDEKQQFAIDQFLMQGGTVVLAASSFTSISAAARSAPPRQPTGLEDWLAAWA